MNNTNTNINANANNPELTTILEDNTTKITNQSMHQCGININEINNNNKQSNRNISRSSSQQSTTPSSLLLIHSNQNQNNKPFLNTNANVNIMRQQDGHFSMMEYAMMNFKQSIDKLVQI